MHAQQLTGQELSDLHNANCYMFQAIRGLEDVLAPSKLEELKKVQALIEKGIGRARKESDKIDDAHRKTANALAKSAQIKMGIWSAGAVDFNVVPFPEATKVKYGKQEFPLVDKSWLGLWKAADLLIQQSGDHHHVFVEEFTPLKRDATVLELSCGS